MTRPMDDLVAEISGLHRQVHRDDPLPTSEAERQAATITARLLQSIRGFAEEGLSPRLIEGAFFYQWLRWTTWNHGLDESIFEAWSEQMEAMTVRVIRLLNGIAAKFRDTEPNPDMRRLSAKIQEAKDAYGVIQSAPLSRSEVEQQADRVNRELFGVVGDFVEKQLDPGIVESALLYYWVRVSTLHANAPEEFFTKLERNWPDMMLQVGAWVSESRR